MSVDRLAQRKKEQEDARTVGRSCQSNGSRSILHLFLDVREQSINPDKQLAFWLTSLRPFDVHIQGSTEGAVMCPYSISNGLPGDFPTPTGIDNGVPDP